MRNSSTNQSGLIQATLPLLIACVVLAGGTPADDGEKSRARAGKVASVRKLLGLEYPYSIERLDMYLDGGSYGGVIRDARGNQLLFAWDGREPIPPHGPPPEGPRLSYLGAAYPARPEAKPLGVGTPREQALVFVLRSFADSQIPQSQDSLYALCFKYTDPSESRRQFLVSLLPKQQIAFDALWIARYLERQALPGGFKGWPWPKPP